jgi:hypothetical protein
MNRVIFIKEYCWESLNDLERDVSEALDEDYNALLSKGLPGEFTGTIKVTIEYISEEPDVKD